MQRGGDGDLVRIGCCCGGGFGTMVGGNGEACLGREGY